MPTNKSFAVVCYQLDYVYLTNNAANITASSGKAITCQNGREYPLRNCRQRSAANDTPFRSTVNTEKRSVACDLVSIFLRSTSHKRRPLLLKLFAVHSVLDHLQ